MNFLFHLLLAILAIVTADIDHGYIKYSDLAGKPYEVTYNKRSLLINGKPSLFLSGSVHPPRFTVGIIYLIFIFLFNRYVGWNLERNERRWFKYG